MDLSNAGSDLLGATEANVLRALARLDEPMSGRQIASLAGEQSHSTTQRILHRYRRIGLVEATQLSSATLYRLNREHVLWGPLREMLDAAAAVDRQIADLVAGEFGDSARVAAFGSVAAGTSRPDSDYDVLLVVGDDVPAGERERVATTVADLIERLTGNDGQVIDVSESELRDLELHGAPIVAEWKQHARPIDGKGPLLQLRNVA